jgi:hypothetical protein
VVKVAKMACHDKNSGSGSEPHPQMAAIAAPARALDVHVVVINRPPHSTVTGSELLLPQKFGDEALEAYPLSTVLPMVKLRLSISTSLLTLSRQRPNP